MGHERDPDDWFDEPDTSYVPDRRVPRVPEPERRGFRRATADDWLGRAFTRRGVALVAGIAVACVLIGLAAAGVFSGGGTKPAAPASTATTPTTTGATSPQTTATKPSVRVPAEPLAPGNRGSAVKLLQQALARLGYPVGAVDGVYGPSTEQAVVRFQRAAGLAADGILGPNTLRALAKAIRNAG